MKYSDLNDYELLSYVSDFDDAARNIMFEKYRPLITDRATYLINYCRGNGLDINDLIQEGMVGLDSAISSFNEAHDTMFYTYACKCINTRMVSTIIKASRTKHRVLNESVLLEISDEDQSNNFGKSLADNSYNPENILINEENKNEILNLLNENLNENEMEIINLRIGGFKYKEIADMLGKDIKSIDNSITRIRNKLRVIFKDKI